MMVMLNSDMLIAELLNDGCQWEITVEQKHGTLRESIKDPHIQSVPKMASLKKRQALHSRLAPPHGTGM